MTRKILLIPNLLMLICALILYHKSFLAGQVTKTGLLVSFAALLPLLYVLWGKMWWQLEIVTALVNSALLVMSGYIFSATSYMLMKNGMLSFSVYAALLITWLLAAAVVTTGSKRSFLIIVFNVALISCAVITYYLRASMQWSASLNAALFGGMMLVSAFNIYYLLRSVYLKNV